MGSNIPNPFFLRGAPRSSRDRAREQFLQSIKINKPEVLTSLARDVLPTYHSIYEIVPIAMNNTELDILARKLFSNIRSKRRKEFVESLIRVFQYDMMYWGRILERDPRDGVPEYNVKHSLEDPENRADLEEHLYDFLDRSREVLITRKSKRSPDGIDQSSLELLFDLGIGIYKIYEDLYQWSLRWNLTDKWFLNQGLQTLNLWCRNGTTDNWDWFYTPKLMAILSPFGFKFDFSFVQWYPEADSWALYKKRARNSLLAKFEEKLNAYREQVEQREQGVKRQSRARDKRSEVHFLWLIEFQINGLEIQQIVDKYFDQRLDLGHPKGLDYSTVWEAIESLATVLALTLRPKRGKG